MVSATLPVGSPGSSPLTRGKHPKQGALFLVLGLIPAHTGKTSSSSCITGLSPAQPHSHGENKQLLVAAASQRGSSPLTRGKLRQRPPTAPISRLIPAHAGNRQIASNAKLARDSSPLTRGKRTPRGLDSAGNRLIPVHAGKTCAKERWAHPLAAHPRSRGENDSQAGSWQPWWGSSPLTRGKRARRSGGRTRWRLIPSHAGKTTHSVKETPAHRVHPRSHGENGSSICWKPYHVGSSPLTQGKHHDPDHQSAGTVLPRSHGENKQLLVAAASQRGSSPPTRGKHQADRPRRRKDGLIPAHAGKTRFCLVCPRRPRAHPRSHRENRSDMQEFLNALGSSPLMRGKRPAVDERSRSNGLIPAHARITSSSSPPGVKARAHPHSHRENVMILTTSRPVPFFPAHAGKTATSPPSPSCGPAHPRSRGENQCRSLIFCARSGSSPLTRGKPY